MATRGKDQVFVVGGNAVQIRFFRQILDEDGIDVVAFSEVDHVMRHIYGGNVPGLIVADLHTPGIDGWRLCRLLRSRECVASNNTPILVYSDVYSGADVTEISRDLGASRFLSMPCETATARAVIAKLLKGEGTIPDPVALIMDDDPIGARIVARAMKKCGYSAATAGTAGEGAAIFERVGPAVVILDHHLPDAKGLDIIENLKKPGTQAVVMVITGDMSVDLAVEYMKRGADAFIRKPFDFGQIVGELHRAQRQRSLLRVEELLEERSRSQRDNDARVLHASRLASLGEMAAGIAHEINNPISGMMNCAEILASEFEAGSEERQFADMILNEGRRAAGIVKRLVGFSKQRTEDSTPEDVADVVSGSLTLLQSRLNKSGVQVELDVPDSLPPLVCRKVQIQQSLLSLLINACDALDERYPEKDPGKLLRVIARVAGDDAGEMCITVEDEGCGMHPDTMQKLFDPLFTTKESGTGLGLAIAQGVVKSHGGRIEVEGEPGAFARFHILLPLAPGGG